MSCFTTISKDMQFSGSAITNGDSVGALRLFKALRSKTGSCAQALSATLQGKLSAVRKWFFFNLL